MCVTVGVVMKLIKKYSLYFSNNLFNKKIVSKVVI